MIPGEVFAEEGELVLNEGRATRRLTVANTGDRPVQVGSHYHFAETNPALSFERERARGYRLDIPAGTAVRFEPGQEREVALVAFAGRRHVIGFQGAVDGPVDAQASPYPSGGHRRGCLAVPLHCADRRAPPANAGDGRAVPAPRRREPRPAPASAGDGRRAVPGPTESLNP